MEREIRFRGKRIDTGQWVFGSYHLHERVKLCIASKEQIEANKQALILFDGMADWNLAPDIHTCDVIPETVGQLTGLKDKDGVYIYEGDILDFDEGEWGGKFTPEVIRMENIIGDWNYCGSLGDVAEWRQVIGNVHDNPELLK